MGRLGWLAILGSATAAVVGGVAYAATRKNPSSSSNVPTRFNSTNLPGGYTYALSAATPDQASAMTFVNMVNAAVQAGVAKISGGPWYPGATIPADTLKIWPPDDVDYGSNPRTRLMVTVVAGKTMIVPPAFDTKIWQYGAR